MFDCERNSGKQDPVPASNSKPKDRLRFPVLLRTTWFSLNKAFRDRLAETNLTPAQFTSLRCLADEHPRAISQRKLADLTSSNPNNVADLVERLESKGWIRREKDPGDSRRKTLCLTEAGRKTYAEARREALALQEEVLEVVPANEREDFLFTLGRINENLSKEAHAPPST